MKLYTCCGREEGKLSKSLGLGLLSFAFFLATFGVASAQEAGTPKAYAEQPVYQFENTKEGDKVKHIFVLKNLGNAALSVSDVRADCGCTVARLEKNTIEPNGQAELDVTFDTNNFDGFKSRVLRVYTNDPKTPFVIFRLEGNVVGSFSIKPPRIYFGNINRGETPARKFDLTVNTDKYSVTGVESTDGNIEVEGPDMVSKNSGTANYRVSVKPNAPLGILRTDVLIKTSNPDRPALSVPVFAVVEGDLKLVPTEVSFGLLEGPLDNPVSQDAKLINKSGAPLKDIKVESDNEFIKVDIKPNDDSTIYALHAVLGRGAIGSVRAKAKITWTAASGEEQVLTLPVYGIVARRSE